MKFKYIIMLMGMLIMLSSFASAEEVFNTNAESCNSYVRESSSLNYQSFELLNSKAIDHMRIRATRDNVNFGSISFWISSDSAGVNNVTSITVKSYAELPLYGSAYYLEWTEIDFEHSEELVAGTTYYIQYTSSELGSIRWCLDTTNPYSEGSHSINSNYDLFAKLYSPTSVDLNKGLVAYYALDQKDFAKDSTGRYSSGPAFPVTDAPIFVESGFSNGARYFDGINDRYGIVSSSTQELFEPLRPFTVSVIINQSSYDEGIILGGEFEFGVNSAGKVMATWYGSGYVTALSDITLSLNEYHFIQYISDGETLRFIIDGVEDINSFNVSAQNSAYSTVSWSIGEGQYKGNFKGIIDELSVYDRALTVEESAEWYNEGEGNFYNHLNPFGDHESLYEDLISYYSFDNNISTDDWGLKHADPVNTGVSAECVLGQCQTFDGSSAYLNITDQEWFESNEDVTLSMWVNQQNINSNDEYLFSKGLRIFTDEGNMFISPTGSEHRVTFSTSEYLTNGEWFHLGVVFNGTETTSSDRLKIYINGVLINIIEQGTLPTTTGSSYQDMIIGKKEIFNFAHFQGKMDEFGLWDRALSASEINYLYNDNKGVVLNQKFRLESDLLINLTDYFSFNILDNQDSLWADYGANQFSSEDEPVHSREGILGGAYAFSTNSDHILALPGVFSTKNKTFSIWYKSNNYGNSNNEFLLDSRTSGYNEFNIMVDSSGVIKLFHNEDSSTPWMYGNIVVDDGDWHHLAVTYNNHNTELKLYIDGILDVSRDDEDGVISGTALNLGNRYNSIAGNLENAILDEVGVWSRVLSANEIKSLYNFGYGSALLGGQFDIPEIDINLHSPFSGAIINYSNSQEFVANITARKGLINCSLILDGDIFQSINYSSTSLFEINETFVGFKNKGPYEWYINCQSETTSQNSVKQIITFNNPSLKLITSLVIDDSPITDLTININSEFDDRNVSNSSSEIVYSPAYSEQVNITIDDVRYAYYSKLFDLNLDSLNVIDISLAALYNLSPILREQDGSPFDFNEQMNGASCSVFDEQIVPNDYYCEGEFHESYPCSQGIDLYTNTYAKGNGTTEGTIYFNYSRPVDATTESIWSVKRDYINYQNYSLSDYSTCWKPTLEFKMISNEDDGEVELYCKTDSTFVLMDTYVNNGEMFFQSMYWTDLDEVDTCGLSPIQMDVKVFCEDQVIESVINATNVFLSPINCSYSYWLIKAIYNSETYYRTLIPDSNNFNPTLYMLDLNQDELVNIKIKITDMTGDYSSGSIQVNKFIGGVKRTVIEQLLNLEDSVSLWLDKDETYEFCAIDNSGDSTCYDTLVADANGIKYLTLPDLSFGLIQSKGLDLSWKYKVNKNAGTISLDFTDTTDSGVSQFSWLVFDEQGNIQGEFNTSEAGNKSKTFSGLDRHETYYTRLEFVYKGIPHLEQRKVWSKSATVFDGFGSMTNYTDPMNPNAAPEEVNLMSEKIKLLVAIIIPVLIMSIFTSASALFGYTLTIIASWILFGMGWYRLIWGGKLFIVPFLILNTIFLILGWYNSSSRGEVI